MQDSSFEGLPIEDIDVAARVAENDLRQIWRELDRLEGPDSQRVRDGILGLAQDLVEKAQRSPGPREIEDARAKDRPEIRIYVLELAQNVLRDEQFWKRNHKTYFPGRDCLYVGHTDQALQYRFLQHLEHERASPIAHQYGLRFRPEFYETLEPLTNWDAALDKEAELGRVLQSEGYGVWFKRLS